MKNTKYTVMTEKLGEIIDLYDFNKNDAEYLHIVICYWHLLSWYFLIPFSENFSLEIAHFVSKLCKINENDLHLENTFILPKFNDNCEEARLIFHYKNTTIIIDVKYSNSLLKIKNYYSMTEDFIPIKSKFSEKIINIDTKQIDCSDLLEMIESTKSGRPRTQKENILRIDYDRITSPYIEYRSMIAYVWDKFTHLYRLQGLIYSPSFIEALARFLIIFPHRIKQQYRIGKDYPTIIPHAEGVKICYEFESLAKRSHIMLSLWLGPAKPNKKDHFQTMRAVEEKLRNMCVQSHCIRVSEPLNKIFFNKEKIKVLNFIEIFTDFYKTLI